MIIWVGWYGVLMAGTVAVFKAQFEVQTSKEFQNSAEQTFELLFETPIVYLKYSKTLISSKVTEWTVLEGDFLWMSMNSNNKKISKAFIAKMACPIAL